MMAKATSDSPISQIARLRNRRLSVVQSKNHKMIGESKKYYKDQYENRYVPQA